MLVARDSGNRFWGSMIAMDAANLQARAGAADAALISFRELFIAWRGTTDMFFFVGGVGGLIVLLHRLGRMEPGAILLGALVKRVDRKALVAEVGETVMLQIRSALGQEAYAAAQDRGEALQAYEVFDFALAEIDRALQAT